MEIKDGKISYFPEFLEKHHSKELFDSLLNDIEWRADKITIFGKVYNVPRLQAWYGDPGMSYSYSNIDLDPLPWTPTLIQLKKQIEEVSEGTYNSVLLNLYRDGKDSNGWHSDNEKELGPEPEIASVTLGQERVFQMKHKKTGEKKNIMLLDGSLLIMAGKTQTFWKHQIPKSARPMEPRINLTFRRIFT